MHFFMTLTNNLPATFYYYCLKRRVFVYIYIKKKKHQFLFPEHSRVMSNEFYASQIALNAILFNFYSLFYQTLYFEQ